MSQLTGKLIKCKFAKRKLDESVFFGNRIQVSYAPQYESLNDTKEKLEGRRKQVLARLNNEERQRWLLWLLDCDVSNYSMKTIRVLLLRDTILAIILEEIHWMFRFMHFRESVISLSHFRVDEFHYDHPIYHHYRINRCDWANHNKL
ncbi:hypothetical protein LXL04_020768 [Taraxacum kok-saghyz]